MILVIDNYDSFVHILLHLMGTITTDVLVLQRDQYNLKEF